MRIGVVGLGKVGEIRVREFQKLGASVIGYFDPARPDASEPSGLRRFSSLASILESPAIDCIAVATPNQFTADTVVAALRAGKHVLAEKPPGRNHQEFRSIAEASRAAPGQVLMFGMNHRHKSSVRELLKVKDSGKLGDLVWVRCRYGKEPKGSAELGWRDTPSKSGGGILLDQGIHGLDLILRLIGEPSRVEALLSGPAEGLENNAFVQLRSRQGNISASLHSTSVQWRYLFSLELSFTRGSIALNGLRTPSGNYGAEILTAHQVLSNDQRRTTERQFVDDDSWFNECKMFKETVQVLGTPAEGSLSDAELLVKTLDRAYAADPDWNRPEVEPASAITPGAAQAHERH